MTTSDIFPAWSRILRGYRPLLSIEITKECPLRCPGCYAYEPGHLGNGVELRQLGDLREDRLVEGVLDLVRRLRPIHLSIVGGEPLVRYRELDRVLPQLDAMGIEVQLVTSAVRPIPQAWARIGKLHLVVSIDGLQPEHDKRRFPATYERILQNIAGHSLIVHCTITRQMLARPDALERFAAYWSDRAEIRKIWFSLYTPQEGDESVERLRPQDRERVLDELEQLRRRYAKVDMPNAVLRGLRTPPASPQSCIFAQVTNCVSADLKSRVTPCQFGGKPVCGECGCLASAGMASIGDYRLAGLVKVADLLRRSHGIGRATCRISRPGLPARS
jgi:MoaA/NifB/PqqE/SkfB family radical SAM enzyme